MFIVLKQFVWVSYYVNQKRWDPLNKDNIMNASTQPQDPLVLVKHLVVYFFNSKLYLSITLNPGATKQVSLIITD